MHRHRSKKDRLRWIDRALTCTGRERENCNPTVRLTLSAQRHFFQQNDFIGNVLFQLKKLQNPKVWKFYLIGRPFFSNVLGNV